MKTGAIISGAAHGLILVLLVFRIPWLNPPPPDPPEVANVTVLSVEEYEASLREVGPEMMTEMAEMFQPTTEANDAARPDDAMAVNQTEIDVTEDPSERDTDANLDALLQPQLNVEVAVESDQIVSPAPDIQDSVVVGVGTEGTSTAPSLSSPAPPRSAPTVADFSAPALPNINTTSDRNIEEQTPDETTDEPAEEPEEASTVEDTVASIQPEAQPDVEESAAPPRAAVPVRRPSNIAQTAAEILEPDTPEPEEPPAEEPEDDTIDDLLGQIDEPTESETPPATNVQLSSGQRRGIVDAIQSNWNKSILIGRPDYETLVVRVEVDLSPTGDILSDVRAISPRNPQGDFEIAFEAARRAILRAGNIPLPAGKFPDGVTLILNFHPRDGVGVN